MNAGGKVTDYSGGENFYNGHEVLATNGKLHNEFLKIVGKKINTSFFFLVSLQNIYLYILSSKRVTNRTWIYLLSFNF